MYVFTCVHAETHLFPGLLRDFELYRSGVSCVYDEHVNICSINTLYSTWSLSLSHTPNQIHTQTQTPRQHTQYEVVDVDEDSRMYALPETQVVLLPPSSEAQKLKFQRGAWVWVWGFGGLGWGLIFVCNLFVRSLPCSKNNCVTVSKDT